MEDIYLPKSKFANEIAGLCFAAYDRLGKAGKPVANKEWTLLSGILYEKSGHLELVSLATGTKCIGAKSMRPDGTIVNDSHAEVLARRGFIRYLLEEMRVVEAGGSSKVLESSGSKYRIKDDVKWHMFTSHVPCGDASIIPMKDIELREPDKKRQRIDIHRTGAKPVHGDPRQDKKEAGPEYHTRGAVRVKPGRGDPTLSLSCSDKIARWIYVGLQGGLLSNLMEESIKLSTIVVGGGGPFNKDVLTKSLIARAQTVENPPTILQSDLVFFSSLEKVKGGKPAPASIIWSNVKEKQLEVAVEGRRQGATTKDPTKGMLKICKRELFQVFLTLCSDNLKNLTYREVKDKSLSYRLLCNEFKNNMGCWSDKPPLENFRP